MTVSSTTRIASFAGNGSASIFAFAFMVFAPADVVVIETNNTTGVESLMALSTDYTVALNFNQAVYPGGTVTLTAGALATGITLIVTSAVPETQGTDLTNSGGFYPEVLTTSLDRLTVLVQQLQLAANRSLSIPAGDILGLTTGLGTWLQRAGMFLTFDANGNAQTIISVASLAALVLAAVEALPIGYGETIATGGQTVFTVPTYTPGLNKLFVTAGGVFLTNGLDYTETNTHAITLTQAAAAGEVYTFRSL
jgi:hypothetical protein